MKLDRLVLGTSLCAALVGGAASPGCLRPAVGLAEISLEEHGFDFDPYDVTTGFAGDQTVLTGSILGGPVEELVTLSVDADNDRLLRVYAFTSGAWTQELDTTLPPEVSFVDVVEIGGHDRLVTFEPGRLNWFDPESETNRLLLRVDTDLNHLRRRHIPHLDISLDVNGDDRDDLLVPDIGGFWVIIQLESGAFADPVKLGPPFDMARIHEADGYRHVPWAHGRVHSFDYDRDGRSDLVYWDRDHFEVHLQDERGLFSTLTRTFTTDVPFDSDDRASLAAPHHIRRRRRDSDLPGDKAGRVLHSLTDVDDDGVADLVIFSLKIESMWSVHSTYEVHLGAPGPDGGTVFAREIATAIHSEGIPFGLEPQGFDQNPQLDVLFTTLDLGLGMITRGLLTRSVSLNLGFYLMDGGVYPDSPQVERRIKAHAPGETGKKGIHFPSVLIGDVNGDRLSDLLVQRGRDELRVYVGVAGPELFARRPRRVSVSMPTEEYTWLVDLNQDGKQDILMHHPSRTEPHRITTLIAR